MATLELDFGPQTTVVRRVFLAGKITGNPWREQLVRGDLTLHPEAGEPCVLSQVAASYGDPLDYPVLEKAVGGLFDYVGPFYVGCGHYPVRCRHGAYYSSCCQTCSCDLEHGNHGEWRVELKDQILRCNQQAIKRADLVFAWLDDPTAYATLYELGYAAALRKEIWIAGPRSLRGLEIVYETSTLAPVFDAPSPLVAFLLFLEVGFSHPRRRVTINPGVLSPIEAQFWTAWQEVNATAHKQSLEWLTLMPQFPMPGLPYVLDFALIDHRVAIELDGLESHRTTDQIAYDRRRQREIEAKGWRVIRFGGKEVYHDAAGCVEEVRRIITTLPRH